MSSHFSTAGLRIDVDTLRGTKNGAPALLPLLKNHGIKASFFFSVGPDNMGRHLRRLLRPAFLVKMLRSRAASLYGWDILLKGTLWPGPVIGKKAAAEIRRTADEGHEIGLHAWDHHRWQTRIAKLNQKKVVQEMKRGMDLLACIIGRPVDCAAAPAWRISPAALLAREMFPVRYNSDCRGHSIFFPLTENGLLSRPQIPTTLPTYDEVIGRNGIDAGNYNDFLLGLFKQDELNVLTIHAEAEGGVCRAMFADFLEKARMRKIHFRPLGDLLPSCQHIDQNEIVTRRLPGREGWTSCQEKLD
ncbi:MAG: 4-deoxy-4-formamido-L-arabinose-phosphoundecaprenol deformylase [Deltaproteobacteria bacterium]|nr:4-deoxy-4-formamido-L-arabinose-phosphoundecaprenol deformylase [Deltaproteobacteria bacterium]